MKQRRTKNSEKQLQISFPATQMNLRDAEKEILNTNTNKANDNNTNTNVPNSIS